MSLLLMHRRESGLVRAGLEALYDFQKTNLLRYSENFGNAAWGAGPVTPDQAISPRGDLTADEISDTNGSAAQEFVQAAPIISSADSYTFSVYVLKDADETRFPEFRIEIVGGTAERLTAGQLNTATGAFLKTSGAGTMAVTDEGDYWRVALSETDTDSGNTQVSCSILPAFTDVLGDPENVALTGEITVWGAQLNAGPQALIYEQTTDNQVALDLSGNGNNGTLGASAAVEANDPTWRAGRLSFDGVNDYVMTPMGVTQNADALTMQIAFRKTQGAAAEENRTLFGHTAGGAYIRFFNDTSIGFWLSGSVGSAFVQGPTGAILDDGAWKMMTFRWQSGVVQDQVLNANTSIEKETAAPAEGILPASYRLIGMYANSRYFDGEIATVLFYRRFLSDAEVSQNYKNLKVSLAPRGIALP